MRRAAVKELLRTLDEDTVRCCARSSQTEKDPHVRSDIEAGLALADLQSPDAETRLAAVNALKDTLNPDVYNALSSIVDAVGDGTFPEPDDACAAPRARSIATIERWRCVYSTLETLFFGLSLGSVLVLAAIGLAITFGVMGVINMAHGELMMLGAYTAYVVQLLMPNHIGASVLVAIPLAFVVSGASAC